MKTPISQFLIVLFFLLLNSCSSDCPDCPKSEAQLNDTEDLAAYLNGESRILFTKAAVKDDVLELLEAEQVEEGIYQLPIKNVLDEAVMMCFHIAEVENPYAYLGFRPSNPCFEDILLALESDIEELIDGDWEDLEDDILLATGDALGHLVMDVNDDNDKRIEQGKPDDAQKAKDKLKDVKKETKKAAKEAADKIKDKLEQNDKNGAKEEAKKYTNGLKGKWTTEFKFDLGLPYCDQDLFPYYKWGESCEPQSPDLLKTFIKNNITYKVYENAQCNPIANPTITFPCYKTTNLDSIPPALQTYTTSEPVQTRSCIRGTSFCVEQEVVNQIDKIYSDPQCIMLIDINTWKGFSCK